MSDAKPYVESDEHVPDPTDQSGTLDTSGTAGSAHGKVEQVSTVFDVAAQAEAVTAGRALDPKDDEVHESLVVLPDSDRSHDDAVKTVKAKASAAKKDEAKAPAPAPAKEPAKA